MSLHADHAIPFLVAKSFSEEDVCAQVLIVFDLFEWSTTKGPNWLSVVGVASIHTFSLCFIEIEADTIRCLLEGLKEILCMC